MIAGYTDYDETKIRFFGEKRVNSKASIHNKHLSRVGGLSAFDEESEENAGEDEL